MFQLTKSLIYFCYFEGTNFPLFSAVSFAGDKMCGAVRHILFFLFLSAKYSTSKSLVRTAASFSRFRRETEEGRIRDDTERERQGWKPDWRENNSKLLKERGKSSSALSGVDGLAGRQTAAYLLLLSNYWSLAPLTTEREQENHSTAVVGSLFQLAGWMTSQTLPDAHDENSFLWRRRNKKAPLTLSLSQKSLWTHVLAFNAHIHIFALYFLYIFSQDWKKCKWIETK